MLNDLTGGVKSAQNGVYKMSVINGEFTLKLSEDKGKATEPGNKEIVIIEDANGNVVDRLRALEGQTINVALGQRIIRPLIPFQKGTEIVWKPEDPFVVQARVAREAKRFANIHESRLDPGISRCEGKFSQ